MPGPPGNFRGTDVTNTSCSLSWNAPQYDGGSPVTGYNVEMYKWSQWIRMNSTPITACFTDLTDLVKGTKYEFRVCAQNAAGVGPPSKSTTVHVTDVPGCPALDHLPSPPPFT